MTLPLVRLLQLASPALPVGAYTYSQGLEWAVEQGTIKDEAGALQWIGDLLRFNLARFEAPWLVHFMAAWRGDDDHALHALEAEFVASRESAELRAETLQMGHSMKRLLDELPDFPPAPKTRLRDFPVASFPLAWSAAATAWEIPVADAVGAYLWSWAENQVMAAIKAVPLGQAAGQRLLAALGGEIPALAATAITLPLPDCSNFAPGFAIACARHETQYSRLFRS
ncbi:MAG: urease accessory protein UreF [Rhodocyclaceae bacterium]|nr:MAG: urease accessory protein UreF [Rhodocyclaceae bacterium]